MLPNGSVVSWPIRLRVNGDVQTDGISRGARQGYIKRLPRKGLSLDLVDRLDENRSMIEANTLMAYPTSYFGAPALKEWMKERRVRKIMEIGPRRFAKKLIKAIKKSNQP